MNTPRPLTRQQLRELEAELRNERARLERAMGEQVSADSWATAAAADPLQTLTTGALGLQTRTDARYDAVIAAIARLDDGKYGTCTACQHPIPFGRLIVMPEVTSCVSCRPRG